MLAVVEELHERLLDRERGLDSMEGAIVAWQDHLMTFEHALGRALFIT
jgi:hypothetical protein